MASLKRPSTRFSFTDWNRNQPTVPPPGDMLDAVIADLREAVISTQQALAELRRDDGKLKNGSVGLQQLDRTFADQLIEELRRDARGKSVGELVVDAQSAAGRAIGAEQAISLFAKDAERAATVAMQALSAVQHIAEQIAQQASGATKDSNTVTLFASEAEDWANYSHAQADNAIKAKDEALAWAEYLAGPVVNSADAPAYIQSSAWPNGLYYQPVEGYGGDGGLWSAKWWAIRAQTIVGPWAFYYFGPWPTAPGPGMRNPQTGQVIPNPIGIGSIYYDTTSKQAMVWDGSAWVPATTPVAGWKAQYVYVATAGQTNFSGPDVNGQSPVVGTAGSDVFVNGVLQVQGASYDYTVNTSTNTLTMSQPLPAGAVVQWSLIPQKPAANPVKIYAVTLAPAAPDGTNAVFTMSYSGGAVNATSAIELQVSVDGVIQQSGVDYNASGASLNFVVAPRADARVWVRWLAP